MWKYTPDFGQLLKVLRHEKPDRPVLFELFLSTAMYEHFAGYKADMTDPLSAMRLRVDGSVNAGYDYAFTGSPFAFTYGNRTEKNTISLNEGSVITDRRSFEEYPWPDPDAIDYSCFEKITPYMPDNFKLMIAGPNGVLENVIRLVGYDNLCYMLYDDEELVKDIFDAVGSRLLRMYEICLSFDSVGALMSNDDWGFNTETFLSTKHMRQFVFPWHKKIVAAAHAVGKPAMLHSCGNADKIMDDIIDDISFDAKHSFEDNIIPIEDAYRKWGSRISLLGGMDMGMMARATPETIAKRAAAMLEESELYGGYALGTGNSIADYIPFENYMAMTNEALKRR